MNSNHQSRSCNKVCIRVLHPTNFRLRGERREDERGGAFTTTTTGVSSVIFVVD